ncbi:hypothetical protein V6N11_038846 [Hibiscus sabdariffa]|uniref:Uncharacterized protein n=1 Tax=Hibiscus sabdariffa TaxID=183260 RepID=A0ABR2SL81_9ROSI
MRLKWNFCFSTSHGVPVWSNSFSLLFGIMESESMVCPSPLIPLETIGSLSLAVRVETISDCQLLHAPREEDRFPVSAPTNRYRYGVLHLRLEENSFFSNIMQCHDSRWNKDYLSSLMSDEDVLDFQCY